MICTTHHRESDVIKIQNPNLLPSRGYRGCHAEFARKSLCCFTIKLNVWENLYFQLKMVSITGTRLVWIQVTDQVGIINLNREKNSWKRKIVEYHIRTHVTVNSLQTYVSKHQCFRWYNHFHFIVIMNESSRSIANWNLNNFLSFILQSFNSPHIRLKSWSSYKKAATISV